MNEFINQVIPEQILFWHWWAVAVALLLLEALLPGTFFIWMAISAALVGSLLLLIPGLSVELQTLLFSVASVISIVGVMGWRKSHPVQAAPSTLNRRGQETIDQHYVLTEAVVSGRGLLIVNDTRWTITGPDCPAGSHILITAINNGLLQFELAETGPD